MSHEFVEKNVVILGILTFLAVIWGGLVQIVPLFFDDELRPAESYVKPYEPLRLAGFNIYVREGCYGCHSQMIRPFRWETERYGHYSVAPESMYDRPFQWGSKRTGPDLARVGGRYSDDWHYQHLLDPRSVVRESNMPAYPWLAERPANVELTRNSIKTKMKLGEPYTQADIDSVEAALKDKTEMDALIAYLQGLGVAFKENR
ncbi:MAG: cytochrome-c oxidase, cbb3-type subunit II [Cardiobacteriaceae bacterium]|nr:cytochrome-c oxidase, cbb3-type subunit II [Cardiobacteriaceae bacterium]